MKPALSFDALRLQRSRNKRCLTRRLNDNDDDDNNNNKDNDDSNGCSYPHT